MTLGYTTRNGYHAAGIMLPCFYARTSKEKDDAFSVDTQVKAMVGHFEKEYGYTGVDISIGTDDRAVDWRVCRENCSGTKQSRPELDRIRPLMRAGKINVLVIYSTDRFARKLGLADLLLDELIEYGVQLYILSWGAFVNVDPMSDDRTRYHFESMFGDRERRMIVERTTRGKREMLTGGQWIPQGAVRYGYRWNGKKKKESAIYSHPSEASVVILIFDLFLHGGWSVRQIATYLTDQGIPTRSKALYEGKDRRYNTRWSVAMIYHILREKAYIGIWTWGKTSKIGDQPQVMEFPELAIISQDVWNQVQTKLDEGRRTNAPNESRRYLMARRMYCGICKEQKSMKKKPRSMSAAASGWHRKKIYPLYRCSGKAKALLAEGATVCPLPSIHAAAVDAHVWSFIEALVSRPELLRSGYEEIRAQQVGTNDDGIATLEAAKKIVAKYRRQKEQITDLYLDGQIDKTEHKQRTATLNQSIAEAEAIVTEMEGAINVHVLNTTEIAERIIAIGRLRELLQDVPPDEPIPYEIMRKFVETLDIAGYVGLADDPESGQKNRPYLDIAWCGVVRESVWVLPTDGSTVDLSEDNWRR
jgi:site-specific DNA recombinase